MNFKDISGKKFFEKRKVAVGKTRQSHKVGVMCSIKHLIYISSSFFFEENANCWHFLSWWNLNFSWHQFCHWTCHINSELQPSQIGHHPIIHAPSPNTKDTKLAAVLHFASKNVLHIVSPLSLLHLVRPQNFFVHRNGNDSLQRDIWTALEHQNLDYDLYNLLLCARTWSQGGKS